MKLAAIIMMAVFSAGAFAHEGHDKTPGKSAPHGGVVQGANQLDLEMVAKSDGVALYPYGKEMKPIPVSELTIEGKATFPRKGKPVDVGFKPEGDALVAQVDSKGAYRYSLDLVVTYQGKKSKIKFNVEPQQ